MWVLISLGAGMVQTARNGLARSLTGVLPSTLLSWARFAFNLPFATALVAGLYLLGADGAPQLSVRFLALCLLGGAGQLLGNVALVEAFRAGTFAQAIVVHKTEAVLAALVGFALFGETPSPLGWVGIVASAAGVALIAWVDASRSADRSANRSASPAERSAEGPARRWRLDRATGLALASAGLLVVASFGIQRATEDLIDRNPNVDGTFTLAATTLFHVTWMEVVALSGWLLARERAALAKVPDHLPRLAGIGFTSFVGSLGWFWAFSLTYVAFVKAVGQIESVLSVLLAIVVWKERRTWDQLPGIALTVAGILLIVVS